MIIESTKPDLTTDAPLLGMQCSTLFSCFSEAIKAMDEQLNWEYFTIGKNGKKPYHFWTVGNCGCYYAFRCMSNGNAGAKRQIEEKMIFRVFHK